MPRPSLFSLLRAFVGSSDKLVRGAGRRPPPNRLSQKRKENERLGVGGSSPGQPPLWERDGEGFPSPKGVHLQAMPAFSPSTRAKEETPNLKELQPNLKEKGHSRFRFEETYFAHSLPIITTRGTLLLIFCLVKCLLTLYLL